MIDFPLACRHACKFPNNLEYKKKERMLTTMISLLRHGSHPWGIFFPNIMIILNYITLGLLLTYLIHEFIIVELSYRIAMT